MPWRSLALSESAVANALYLEHALDAMPVEHALDASKRALAGRREKVTNSTTNTPKCWRWRREVAAPRMQR